MDAVSVKLAWGWASDTGPVRVRNEDSVLAQPPWFVVADGMGGHNAGEVASALAVEVVSSLQGRDDIEAVDIEKAVESANDQILSCAREDHSRSGMGTTLAGVVVGKVGGVEHWLAFNVGDSRVYRFDHGVLTQVSVDHSEVQELIDAGLLDAQDAERHPLRNVVTRALGSDPAPAADVWVFPPVAGERLVVVSDGVTRELSDAVIASLLAENGDPQNAASAVVAAAGAAGGHDNASAVVVDLLADEDVSEAEEDTQPRPGAR